MPKRLDINKLLIIGSGPIKIGQACEFDYSGTQACKALREEGYEIILVNSNPATIMTDPNIAHKTYIEALDLDMLVKIIEKEKPDALLPTLGGQTALNLAMELEDAGILQEHGIEMLGASIESINKAESRKVFRQVVADCGLKTPWSRKASTWEEAVAIKEELGLPCLIRASFTLGGRGSGIAYTEKEFEAIAKEGIAASMVSEISIEQLLEGWKEFELEMMADQKGNCIVVCGVENIDPLGVHTGDSVTVAPILTLSNRQYQEMRNAAIKLMRAVGVSTGGANIQFAVNPKDGDLIVIEMNPRVSRSSALASKATGYPIAKFAAKLAVGYSLDELQNDITYKTACFEPSLDYCVIKFPKFNFEKFEDKDVLGTSMKAIGEVMAIGRTFKEAFNKGLQSLELDEVMPVSQEELPALLKTPNSKRFVYILEAFKMGMSIEKIHALTQITPWFLYQFKELVLFDFDNSINNLDLLKAKQLGFSDTYIANQYQDTAIDTLFVQNLRKEKGVVPTYKLVDTCAGEFEAYTPYYYSCYEEEDEIQDDTNPKVMILGSGANRIGQGIEFDYSCVQAASTLKKMGYTCIMVNSNPETVSTDFDVSDRLYFEPLTVEHILNIYEKEQPIGILVQFGGQTPFNLIQDLIANGVNILGSSPESIELAENRSKFSHLLNNLSIQSPEHWLLENNTSIENATAAIHYPILIRPSFVIGGSSMTVVYNQKELINFIDEKQPSFPLQLDSFLENAVEIDVDLISDGTEATIIGISEQIQTAGIHSGDSACAWPSYSISPELLEEIELTSKQIALQLDIVGLLNLQIAIKNNTIYIIEANPRSSRTIPFLCKAQSINWVDIATRVMLGTSLKELNVTAPKASHYAIKEVIFPFSKFPNCPIELNAQMKSTGEVMGQDKDLGLAYFKAKKATNLNIPLSGKVYFNNCSYELVDKFLALGFLKTENINEADLLVSLGIGKVTTENYELRKNAWDNQKLILMDERECELCLRAIESHKEIPLNVQAIQYAF